MFPPKSQTSKTLKDKPQTRILESHLSELVGISLEGARTPRSSATPERVKKIKTNKKTASQRRGTIEKKEFFVWTLRRTLFNTNFALCYLIKLP